VTRALSAELFKLRTTRTSWGVTLGSLALVLVISTIAALAADFSAQDTPKDVLQIAGLLQIFALVLGILIVATEFRHGTITPSLLAVPDRVRLVLAKLIAALAAGALLGLIGAVACALIIVPALVDADLLSGDVLELIAGNAVASALFAAIGVGLGALIRNQVGAIIGALGWIFLVEPLLTIIPGFEDVIAKWFPSGAANQAAGTAELDDMLGQVPAALLTAAYAAAFVAAGIVMMRRRDISA
jgi:ABC-2 type transport system permease protein